MTRQQLSPLDTMFLRTEDPTNPMMVTGVMVFGAPIDFERLRETIERRLLRIARFRQRVARPRPPWGTPYWEDDPGFDLGHHLRRVALPPPGDQAALQAVVSQLASSPLDLSRPLWQLHLVEHFDAGWGATSPEVSACGGRALIYRVHHTLGDGVALVHVLLSMADPDPQGPGTGIPQEDQAKGDPDHAGASAGLPSSRSIARYTAARSLVGKGLGVLTHPWRLVDLVRTGTEAVTTLGDLVLAPPDSNPVFRGRLSVTKRAAWSAPVSLGEVKSVGRRLGGTVNDVLMAAMAGAVRRYLQDRGQTLDDDASLRAAIAVNLRPPGAEGDLGNRIGFVYLELPVGIADPADRLRELKRRMDRRKSSLEAPLGVVVLKALGLAPPSVQDALVDFLGARAAILMTNVIGPRQQLCLAGAPLEALMFWVPQSGGVGAGVSILSYAGQVWLGVLVDEGLVPDPEVIIAGFHAEFGALLRVAEEAEEPPSIRQLLARLDDTLVKLDAILEDAGEPEPGAREASTASHRSPS